MQGKMRGVTFKLERDADNKGTLRTREAREWKRDQKAGA